MTDFQEVENADLLQTQSSSVIENLFPEVLRDPILRKVQFSTISRIDDLVNSIYDEFKHDFFPGEEVLVLLDEGEQLEGSIREKAKFPMIRGPDGSVQREAFSRYFVRLVNQPGDEALLDDKHIRRDRKVFTKQNLRAFLKNSLQRESWSGAPWLVKEHLAIQYRLPMEIPAHLLQDAKLLQNKVSDCALTSARIADPFTKAYWHLVMGNFLENWTDTNRQQQQMLQMRPIKVARRPKNMTPQDFEAFKHQQVMQQQMQQQVIPPPLLPFTERGYRVLTPPQHQPMPHQMQHFNGSYHQPIATRMEPPRPPPPIIKYPIEDLELPPKHNGVMRPRMEFLTEELAEYVEGGRKNSPEDIHMSSMGPLLEVWNTLNVQAEVFLLDSFTFDDFVDALKFSSKEIECELLNEVHCSVLKLLVDEKGKIQIILPEMVNEVESGSSDEAHDTSEVSTPLPDAPAHATRSRLSHVDNARSSTTPAEAHQKIHRAQEMLAERGWIQRLEARDFENGGWVVILVGLLHQFSLNPRQKAACDSVLAELAPMDEEPTQEMARTRYATMNINLRISALQQITMLSLSTKTIRTFLDDCSEDMTEVRKKKLERQRSRKEELEKLHSADQERKILLPNNMPESPKEEVNDPMQTDIDDTLHTNGTANSDHSDEEPTGRSLRGGADRKRKRDEEAARKAKEEVERKEAAKANSKQSKEFKKILSDIEGFKAQIRKLEDDIADCDRDLREANIQRTKVLGRDRFWNRYYWFERNGMPFGGLPNSSTSEYGYANGRIWVQGPSEMEREGFIDLPPAEMQRYQLVHNMTVPERRIKEEGKTILKNADEWGYYDDPQVLDNLIGWLDDRGKREKDLRKELYIWREDIVTYMKAMRDFKDKEAMKKAEEGEEPATRISTRHKTYADNGAAGQRCLKWRNDTARETLGHLHSEQPKPKEKKQPPPRKEGKGIAKPVLNRQGKPVTRQGESYKFR